ncbi:hypothetical protein N7476_000197 [Penicillium atrosanguineum]|uniref:Uncharacterized protein n=1 Tax=Penicillium atrosanguineum TaxID=1132637 RepID=A0A9W9QCF3_9EURO|nr:hypothetical protein N7526_001554 [Penicillium atrosanguineum]KAJ5330414.1 hypothetical protein N7476_000197 [Penicillium atrosanguineum]
MILEKGRYKRVKPAIVVFTAEKSPVKESFPFVQDYKNNLTVIFWLSGKDRAIIDEEVEQRARNILRSRLLVKNIIGKLKSILGTEPLNIKILLTILLYLDTLTLANRLDGLSLAIVIAGNYIIIKNPGPTYSYNRTLDASTNKETYYKYS